MSVCRRGETEVGLVYSHLTKKEEDPFSVDVSISTLFFRYWAEFHNFQTNFLLTLERSRKKRKRIQIISVTIFLLKFYNYLMLWSQYGIVFYILSFLKCKYKRINCKKKVGEKVSNTCSQLIVWKTFPE